MGVDYINVTIEYIADCVTKFVQSRRSMVEGQGSKPSKPRDINYYNATSLKNVLGSYFAEFIAIENA